MACLTDSALSRRAFAAEPAISVAAPDWAAAESLLAMGVAPLAVTDTAVYREWLPEPSLPLETLDLGSRAEPNLEVLAQARPQRIFISNWQISLKPQFERIAPTQVVTLIDPPSSPLANACEAMRSIARSIGRRESADRYLAAFREALTSFAAQLRGRRPEPVLVGVLHENGRQIYLYGEGSWVHEILLRLGLRNALRARPSRFGNALVDLAELAETPDARLLYLDQGERTRRAERALARSTLWRSLPIARPGRIRTIAPFYALGGAPSAWRCARLISAAVLSGPAQDG
ncbi:ABC transporter substrate-binding protein [Hansschlegelia sp.]|uniref:ABC transporter substrate-binding protein n=1 Tax=Hansschlegelia sp. TaxID=2041892 RepID=UPI002CD0C6CA|nr:ABC transporter substrate-binding protein [Hansschlegelia sp.]HVI27875.1 ABC transporter substrate-binding protein [Hansschlegelia sp.]